MKLLFTIIFERFANTIFKLRTLFRTYQIPIVEKDMCNIFSSVIKNIVLQMEEYFGLSLETNTILALFYKL